MDERETRSFLNSRDPSIDRRFRPCPNQQKRLFDEIVEEEAAYGDTESSQEDGRVIGTQSSAPSQGDDGALVYLRLRPVENSSQAYNVSEVGNVLIVGAPSEPSSTSNNKNMIEKHYSFSAIFSGAVEQKEIYDCCVSYKIAADENFTVLTYGTSGSGKTFTLLGDEYAPGIIPRSLEHIFTRFESRIYPHPSLKLVGGRVTVMDELSLEKELELRRQLLVACTDIDTKYERLQQIIRQDHVFERAPDRDVSILIWVSFVELYNELVHDLLEPPASTQHSVISLPPRKNLKIINNDSKVFIKGLTSVYVKSSVEALKLLHYGLRRINYASTMINAKSSRSHCIFFIDVLQYYSSGLIMETSYKFCDLAGSERLDKTGNIGSRLKETQKINTSLMVLGRCLDAANNNSRKKNNEVIPYRNSKLTTICQSALLGKEKLTMIVNLMPTDKFYEENINVLGFASIAKNVIFKKPVEAEKNSRYSSVLAFSKSAIQDDNIQLRNDVERLTLEVDRLNCELEDVKQQRAAALLLQEQELRNQLVDSFEKTLARHKVAAETRLQQELARQQRTFDRKIEALKRQHEMELEDLREEYEELNASRGEKKRRTLEE